MAFYMLCDEVRDEVASGSPYVRPEVLLHRLESQIKISAQEMVGMLEKMTTGDGAMLQVELYIKCPLCGHRNRVNPGEDHVSLGENYLCKSCDEDWSILKSYYQPMFKPTEQFATYQAQKKRA